MRRRQQTETVAGGEASMAGESKLDVFKNRDQILGVRETNEVFASEIYGICRVKANQVMMMKHRGYDIPEEERKWLKCAVDEQELIKEVRGLLGKNISEVIKLFNKKYELNRRDIKSQTAYTYYPYLEGEGGDKLEIGEFQYRDGNWTLNRTEEDILIDSDYETDVKYTRDAIILEDYLQNTFTDVPTKIVIDLGKEESFKKNIFPELVAFRSVGVEVFHMFELYIDYFQHWLVPKQQIVTRTDKLRLLNSHLMIKKTNDAFEKVPNCKIAEMGLPTVHFTDIVVRYMGALPGDIIYWENDSYISSFITKEFVDG
jgi:DNA-directed RNA polymerase subunit H (RpoH/RPB5)